MPTRDTSLADPLKFGLDLGRAHREESSGSVWFYQGTTLGLMAAFASWPRHDLVVPAATNSQPPEAEDRFLQHVVGGAFHVLRQASAVLP